MSVRAIVVDDEPLAREGIELMLREQGVNVVATCADGPQAVRAIRSHSADVVFLDIHLPGMDGFGVIETLGTHAMPEVVFLTAYEQHAVRAFRANAADYLLKPIDSAALAESLGRVKVRLDRAALGASTARLNSVLESLAGLRSTRGVDGEHAGRIALREHGRVRFLAPGAIVRVAASGDYVCVHTVSEEILLRDSMSAMQARLAPWGFCRIHRSHIVNVAHVGTLEYPAGGGCRVVLDDGLTLPVSRGCRDALIEALACGSADA